MKIPETLYLNFFLITVLLIIFLKNNVAYSHIFEEVGFEGGVRHPFLGIDHFLCMLAVGMWGMLIGGRSIWMLPVVFPLIMGLGIYIGVLPNQLYLYQELAIALSLTVIGSAIALNFKPKEFITILIVSFFAIFHGYAHGMEIPLTSNPNLYIIGSIVGTSIIHIMGIVLGFIIIRVFSDNVLRVLGGLIAFSSIYHIYLAFS